MKKALVVYYSRSGFTRQVAEAIARLCVCDIDEICDATGRVGVFGFLRSCYEALTRHRAAIEPAAQNPREYETVIIGTPIWVNHVASPVRSYISTYRNDLRRVAFFCTSERTPGEKVFTEMAELCGRQPIAAIAVTAQQVRDNQHTLSLDPLIRAVSEPQTPGRSTRS